MRTPPVLVVNANTFGGNAIHLLEFTRVLRYKHNLLLKMQDSIPRAAHWTLKSVWNVSRTEPVGSNDILQHGDTYACMVQQEDNLNPAQLTDRARTMLRHYKCSKELMSIYLVPHGTRHESREGQVFLSLNLNARVSTYMGPSATSVVVRRPFTPEDVNVLSVRYAPLCTTVARLNLRMHGAPPYPDSIAETAGEGRCYHEHAIHDPWGGGGFVRMFERYEGPLRVTDEKVILYEGHGARMCITCEWSCTDSELNRRPTVHTTIHGEFHGGVPHGAVNIWVAWGNGKAYHYDGHVLHGQTSDTPSPPTVSHRCAPEAGTRVVDHDAKMIGHRSTFARDGRHVEFNLNVHLQWVLVNTRPTSACLQ
jgi:hypothetical protein